MPTGLRHRHTQPTAFCFDLCVNSNAIDLHGIGNPSSAAGRLVEQQTTSGYNVHIHNKSPRLRSRFDATSFMVTQCIAGASCHDHPAFNDTQGRRGTASFNLCEHAKERLGYKGYLALFDRQHVDAQTAISGRSQRNLNQRMGLRFRLCTDLLQGLAEQCADAERKRCKSFFCVRPTDRPSALQPHRGQRTPPRGTSDGVEWRHNPERNHSGDQTKDQRQPRASSRDSNRYRGDAYGG